MSQKTAIAEIRSINPEEGLAVIELYGGTAKDRELVVGDKLYTHPSASVPEGYVLMPADHLPDFMEKAAVKAAREYAERTGGNCMKTIYKALVEAAITTPQPAPSVPDGYVLVEKVITPAHVVEAGVNCLSALKAAHVVEPRTVAALVFQDMLLAYEEEEVNG